MFGIAASHTVGRLLPENLTGRATLTTLLKGSNLALPEECIAEVVTKSIFEARRQARTAKKGGNPDLADWRANLALAFDSVIRAMTKAKTGEVIDVPFHGAEVNEVLLHSGAVFERSQIKAYVGMPILCEDLHQNGSFIARVLEIEEITLGCVSLSTDVRSDGRCLCVICQRPVAIRIDGGNTVFVCTGDEWVG